MCNRAILAGAVALFSLSIAAVPAWAAHPGANGLIAFIRQVDGHYHVFTISPDGTNEQQLTFAKNADDIAPEWSPDGSRIAFERVRASGLRQIFVIVPGSSDPATNISNSSTNDTAPSWGPNGRRIAFSRDGHIWKMHADGTEQQQITHRPYTDGQPSWSSTGDLAFVRTGVRGWGASIYVRRAGSRTATRLLGEHYVGEGADSFSWPDWSPDGTKLAYNDEWSGGTDGGGGYLEVTTDGQSQWRPDIPCQYCYQGEGAWSPDGSEIAFAGEGSDDLPAGVYTVGSCACDPPATFLTDGWQPAWQPVPPD